MDTKTLHVLARIANHLENLTLMGAIRLAKDIPDAGSVSESVIKDTQHWSNILREVMK